MIINHSAKPLSIHVRQRVVHRAKDGEEVREDVKLGEPSPEEEELARVVEVLRLLLRDVDSRRVVIGDADVVNTGDECDVGEAHFVEVGRVALDEDRVGSHEEDVGHRAAVAAENDIDAEELPHLLLVGLADLHAEGVELLRGTSPGRTNVSEAPVDGAEIAREVHPATVERAFQDAHAELAREDVERGDVCGLVGERAHPVGGEEAGEDASVLVVGHAVHESDAAEAEQLGNAVAPQQTQNVLLLEGGVRRVGEGVEEELQVALGPGVFVELAEDGQVEVAELG